MTEIQEDFNTLVIYFSEDRNEESVKYARLLIGLFNNYSRLG